LPKPTAQPANCSAIARQRAITIVRRREGRYLLRSNLIGIDPAQLWELYIQLTQIEEAFRNLKGDLAIRPIYHQLEERIEAHILWPLSLTACT